ncbi:hypothetical protein QTP88_026326 [Uroleucon formosanum]
MYNIIYKTYIDIFKVESNIFIQNQLSMTICYEDNRYTKSKLKFGSNMALLRFIVKVECILHIVMAICKNAIILMDSVKLSCYIPSTGSWKLESIYLIKKHHLRSTKEHNHSPNATRKDIITAVHNLKRKACETNDTPAQIIQVETNAVPNISQPSLPNNHALRQIIKRVCRKDIPIQPTSIGPIGVLLHLRTINGHIFLSKDASFDNERILGTPRTQNRVEGWHRRFETLVGKCHVGVYTIIEEIKKEQIQMERRAEDICNIL